VEFDTAAESTNKCRPFEIQTEDITEHHYKPRLYLCTVCDKRFTQKTALIRHKRIHNGEKPFICTVCDKRFIRKWHLNNHKRIHTSDDNIVEKRYSCSDCEKSFTSQTALKYHKYIQLSILINTGV